MGVTYHVALPFVRDEAGEIVAGDAQECPDASKAAQVASFLASDPKHCGSIAFSRTGDPALGDFEDAVVIKTYGTVDPLALGG